MRDSQDSIRPDRQPASSGGFPLRVRYCECDPMGVAHHASYVPWFEEARTELLRTSGLSYAQLEAEGVFLAITRLETRFRRPARYDDLLEIRVNVTGGSRVKLEHEYEVVLVERPGLTPEQLATLERSDDLRLATAATTLACIDAGGRPRPLPDWLTPGAHQ